MKLIFLGTGHGVPEKDRYCSSALLFVNGLYYMIDCGAPAADLLVRHGISYNDIRSVFITHRHADHTFGLTRMLDLANWYYKTASFDVYMTEQKGVDAMRAVVLTCEDFFCDDRLRLHTFEAGKFYTDNNISVTAVPTNHLNGVHPSYSLIIDILSGKDAGKRIIFTGDLHHGDASDFPAAACTESSSAIVCELVPFGIPAAMEQWEKCRTERLFVSHYAQKYVSDPECSANLGSALSSLSFAAGIVHDGEEYEI